MSKCLSCYKTLQGKLHGRFYHHSCSTKLFGSKESPTIDFTSQELDQLALQSIQKHLGITGVQPKISLHIQKKESDPNHRMMIIGLWGNFILKPPTPKFPNISILEDLTMHLANLAGLQTATHGLIYLKSGELAYVTRRFDRTKKKQKIAVEDFCQLSELQTEAKYDTSTEKAGKIILKYSAQPGLDAVTFFDLNLFCFLTGNADMHLKNFSLIQTSLGEYIFSPAYDLLPTRLLMPDDQEEMALTVNGKKSKLKLKDFQALGKNLQIADKAIGHSFSRLLKKIPKMNEFIQTSFLPPELQKDYQRLIQKRAKILAE